MSDNLAELIDEAILIADELGLSFDFIYTKNWVRFNFTTGIIRTTHGFTNEEINNFPDVTLLTEALREKVYKMLDSIPKK